VKIHFKKKRIPGECNIAYKTKQNKTKVKRKKKSKPKASTENWLNYIKEFSSNSSSASNCLKPFTPQHQEIPLD